MTSGIHIQISESAAKAMAIGAVALGVIWLISKLSESDEQEYLPREAEEFSHLRAVSPSRLDDIQYDVGIASKVKKLFDDGHHAQAAEEACKHLFDIIRNVSGCHEKDGTILIDVVFIQKKILHFEDTTKAHVRGVEGGFIEGLRYLAKSVRNLLAHDAITISEMDALTHINLACFLGYQVQYNTVLAIEPPAKAANSI